MSGVLDDLLGALKDGRAGRKPDPSSTRGSNPKGETRSVKSSGPLHRISEASVTGTATIDARSAVVKVDLVLPEEETVETNRRRDNLDAMCDAPLLATGCFMDTEDFEQERRLYEKRRAEEGVWQFEPSPRQAELDAKLARSKARAERKPIERLADETAPAEAEPVGPGRTPGAAHPWRRNLDPSRVRKEAA